MQKSRRMQRPKKIGNLCSYALLTCALALAGCGQEQKKAITDSASISAGEAMEVAENVLAKMHFAIDKADVASGYIRTRPLSGAQFFEFWRSDNVGSDNVFLSNLHTIRRTVELKMARREGQLKIDCDVRVQRLSLPERETFSTARAYGIYTRSGPTLQKLKLDAAQIRDTEWIDLDKDEKLAAEIVKRITKRIARRSSSYSRTAESRT